MRPSPAPLFRIPNSEFPFAVPPRAQSPVPGLYPAGTFAAPADNSRTYENHRRSAASARNNAGFALSAQRISSAPRWNGALFAGRENDRAVICDAAQFPRSPVERKNEETAYIIQRVEAVPPAREDYDRGAHLCERTYFSAQEGENNRADRRASIPRVGRKTRRAGQNIMRCSKLLMGGIREFQNTHAELIDRRR